RRHHRGGGDGSLQDQDLPRLPLPADRQTTRQATRPGPRRKLDPHRRLPLAVGPAGPLRRPRRRLPRPPAPPTPNPAADPRTRTPLRQEGVLHNGPWTPQTGVVTAAP